MHILRLAASLAPAQRGAAVAVGNFDGVHRGHQAVLAAAQAAARRLSTPFGVLTFEPHPRQRFRPADPPFRLTPFRAKVLRLRDHGVERLYVASFSHSFSQQSAEAFVREVLVAKLGVRHVAVGEDFVFGHRRAGNAALLRQLAAQLGFALTLVAPVGQGGAHYKSSTARKLLQDGRPREAAAILGDFWRIVGRVRHGDARGRALGFPTANVALGDLVRPRFGIYAVRAWIERETAPRLGVASLGVRPMFGGAAPVLEVHLFDFAGDLYGRHLCVDVVEFLRPEATFAGIPALVRQMGEDAAQAKAILADPQVQRFPERLA